MLHLTFAALTRTASAFKAVMTNQDRVSHHELSNCEAAGDCKIPIWQMRLLSTAVAIQALPQHLLRGQDCHPPAYSVIRF